ncbi:MAG: thiamine-phosphate kinase [Candidatus Methylomirabilales bacterium]
MAREATLRTLGEFGILKRLRTRTPPLPPDVLLGIGDDACIVRPSVGLALVATVDVLVEGRDFRWEWVSPEAVGQRGVTVSLSDVGAMGAIPRYALVALGLPRRMPVRAVDDLYRGIWKATEAADVAVVGGDLSEAPCLILSLTLIGEGEPERLVRRSGAKIGDRIWVTGPLGRAAAGLRALRAGYRVDSSGVAGRRGKKIPRKPGKAVRETIRAQLYPVARYREGRALAEAGLAKAMIDLSDGLASDLTRLADESGVGARIVAGQIPVDSSTVQVARLLGLDPLKLAINGGEDFELLFTSGADPATVQATLVRKGFARPHAIGEVVPAGEGLCLVSPGGRQDPLREGFEHFR